MCQRSITTLGEGCVCGSEGRGCGSGLVCDFAVNRTLSENVCRPNGLPAGSSCVIDDQCVGTCTNGVCDGDDTGVSCTSSDTCNPPNKCVYVDQSISSRQCLSQRTPGGWCVQDADCTSNLCETSNNVCVERASIAAGANCTLGDQCESGYCGFFADGSYGVCLDAARVYAGGEGSPCPGGQAECASGHRCTGSDFDRVCKYTTGTPCGVGECGHGFCSCDNFAQVCVASPRPSPPICDTERLALLASWGTTFFSRAWHLYPSDARSKFAAYYCCFYRSGATFFTSGSYQQNQQGFQLDCAADPPTVVARDAVTYPERCSLTTPVPAENLIIGISAISTEAGTSAAIDLPGRSASAHLSPLSLALSLGIALLVALLV